MEWLTGENCDDWYIDGVPVSSVLANSALRGSLLINNALQVVDLRFVQGVPGTAHNGWTLRDWLRR